jgi:CheY-like chemotaxis protein
MFHYVVAAVWHRGCYGCPLSGVELHRCSVGIVPSGSMSDIKTVLVVDGDVAAITANSDCLQREGFQVQTADDGSEALFQLAKVPIDVVVLDLILPTFSGTEVFKRMRSDDRLREVPVVILSNAPKHKRPQDLRGGPTRFLVKTNTDFPTLLAAIREVLAASSLRAHADPAAELETGDPDSLAYEGAIQSPPINSAESPARKCDLGFLKKAAKALPKIREDCFGYMKSPSGAAGRQHLAELRENVILLHTRSEKAGCARINLLTKPFEALLSSIAAKPGNVTPSILQTIAQAVDCLALIVNHEGDEAFESMLTPQALVVDDDPVSNEVNVTALQQASFDTTCVEDPLTALELLSGTAFDLVVLDVNMPAMTGFEVCEKLRELPQGKTTPVIFLTAFNNFENRKQSVLSGGGDFITKPVSTRELALKATIHLIKSQLRLSQTSTVSDMAGLPDENSNESSNDVSRQPQVENRNLFASGSASNNPRTKESRISMPGADESMERKKEPGAHSGGIPKTQNGKTHDDQDFNMPLPGSADLKLESPGQSQIPDQDISKDTGEKSNAPSPIVRAKVKKEPDMRADNESKTANVTGLVPAKLEMAGTETANLSTHDSSESKLREKLVAAELTIVRIETALKEKEDSYRSLEEELVPLRKIRDQLQQKQKQATGELERLKASLTQETSDRARSETELRSQLNATRMALDSAENALKEKDDSYRLLEEELAPLRNAREQFRQKQQQYATELAEVKSDLAKRSTDHAKSETALRKQTDEARQTAARTEVALKEKETRCQELEQTLPLLRQQCSQLEQSQKETGAELERARADLTRQSAAQAKSESDLRDQLTGAKQALSKTQAALDETQARFRTAAEELSQARRDREQLQDQHQKTVAELTHTKAGLERESSERVRQASECETLGKAKKGLESDLAQLHEALAASNAKTLDVERRLQESTASVARLTAELEKERDQRQQTEQRATSLSTRLRGLHEELGKHLAV